MTQEKPLLEYFRNMYDQIQNNWNVESAIDIFGVGKSNEGTDESKVIKRYYIEPSDKRFQKIYLNFDLNRNIESIVWFLDKNETELLTISELRELFGDFTFRNIIYDETTELTFIPKGNKCIQYINSSILEWVEERKNGTYFFKKDNNEIEIDDKFKVSSLIFKINNNVNLKT